MAARLNFLWCFIGTNRTGKTTEAIRLVKEWRKERPYGKVIAFDPQYKFREAKCVDYYITGEEKDCFGILLQEEKNADGTVKTNPKTGKPLYKFQNSLLVIDDYKALLDSNTMPKSLLKLLALRMDMSMDMIYIVWSPKLILERLSYFTNHFSIFYTESEASDFQDKIANYTLVQKAANVINKYVFSFGRGKFPNFPHAYVYTEREGVNLVNIDPVKFELLQNNAMDEIKTKIEFKKLYPEDYAKAFPDEKIAA